jgi:hypothetical protein
VTVFTWRCAGAPRELGSSPDEARRHVAELMESLAGRFGPAERDPVFESVRPTLARYALVPSRIVDAPALWTRSLGPVREIGFQGRLVDARYRMAVAASPSDPRAPGDYRGIWRLEKLRDDEYEWMAREELSVGGASPEALARALTSAFAAAESTTGGDLAPSLRKDMPRAAAALGRLFSLETARVRHDADGATNVDLAGVLEPDRIRSFAPRFAHYLDDVVIPTRFAASASDSQGARWWEVTFADGRLTLHVRVHGGDLAPLAASPRPIPAHLRVVASGSSKTGFLRSGFHDLRVDVDLTRSPEEKGFVARFPSSPDWDLPIFVPLLLRSALRRPFEGGGALLTFSVVGGEGKATLLTRNYRVAVRENWLVRWFGGYVSGAVSTYRAGEQEADRFNVEALLAIEQDLLALVDPSRVKPALPPSPDPG